MTESCFSSVVLAKAARAAYLFGAAEAAAKRGLTLESSKVLVERWQVLDGLQDALGFAFYGPGEPEEVRVAKSYLVRRSQHVAG